MIFFSFFFIYRYMGIGNPPYPYYWKHLPLYLRNDNKIMKYKWVFSLPLIQLFKKIYIYKGVGNPPYPYYWKHLALYLRVDNKIMKYKWVICLPLIRFFKTKQKEDFNIFIGDGDIGCSKKKSTRFFVIF